jgi:hypothetical protein
MSTAGQATWIQSAIGADGQSYQMSQHDAQACHGAARDVLSVGKLVKEGYEFEWQFTIEKRLVLLCNATKKYAILADTRFYA